MIGTKIIVTNVLAGEIGWLAGKHPNATAVTIAYDDDYPEQEWLVHFDAGYGTTTYVVNDQTGETRLAGLGAGQGL